MTTTPEVRAERWWERPVDRSHAAARTEVQWDGRFEAPCPHGRLVEWTGAPGRNPKPTCRCRSRR